ncbi:hypothetical protein ACEK07_02010, partial [Alcanivoracaceae bacterium MT1]
MQISSIGAAMARASLRAQNDDRCLQSSSRDSPAMSADGFTSVTSAMKNSSLTRNGVSPAIFRRNDAYEIPARLETSATDRPDRRI